MIVPVAVDTVELCTPDDGRVCRPKHVEWTKQRNKIHCIQLHLLVISNRKNSFLRFVLCIPCDFSTCIYCHYFQNSFHCLSTRTTKHAFRSLYCRHPQCKLLRHGLCTSPDVLFSGFCYWKLVLGPLSMESFLFLYFFCEVVQQGANHYKKHSSTDL